MRKAILNYLWSNTTLKTALVGGIWQPFRVTTGVNNFPHTPFAVLKLLGEVPNTEMDAEDVSGYSVIAEITVYDRAAKDGKPTADLSPIDSILDKIYLLLNNHQFSLTSYGWGYGETVYAGTGPDFFDEGWNCIARSQTWQFYIFR